MPRRDDGGRSSSTSSSNKGGSKSSSDKGGRGGIGGSIGRGIGGGFGKASGGAVGSKAGSSVGKGGGGNSGNDKAARQAAEKARQAAWKEKNQAKTTNEYRRDASGNFTAHRTNYGTGVSERGFSQHGRISDKGGVRSYEGAWNDKDFGRDVGRYGRVQTADVAESYMKASQMNLAADSAWQAGRYGDYLRNKLKAMKGFAGVSLENNIADFQNAPLDYVSGLLDNPLVSGAAMMSGLGLPAFGVKVADAIADFVQGEATGEESIRSAAGSLITHTPVGAALGPMQGVAAAFTRSPEEGAVEASGMLGGKVGGIAGQALAGLTNNPYAAAGITAISAAAGSSFAKQQTQQAIAKASTGPSQAPKASYAPSQGKGPTSPLVASGELAVAKQEALQQPAQVDLYAQTVRDLPMYGLDVDRLNNPYYGVV